MRHDAGTRTSPWPVSSYQYTVASDTLDGWGNAYSSHSVVPLCGHQWKKPSDWSYDDEGTARSLTARSPRPEDTATWLVEASVGAGSARTALSASGIHTAISPAPRLAHAKYGIAANGCSRFTTLPEGSVT